MTKEDKKLLLKDLCARLPYGVKVKFGNDDVPGPLTPFLLDNYWYTVDIYIKPYLRPMSSMTKDEREEVEVFLFEEWFEENACKVDGEGFIEILANYDVSGIYPEFCGEYADWLLEHHFDYHGLIERGLALEAPEGMYETE